MANYSGNLFANRADWCVRNGQVITNPWFKHHPRRLYTWIRSPGDRVRNQIDYITINHRFRNAVKNSRTYSGADCESDHNPVVVDMEVRLERQKEKKRKKRLQYEKLKIDSIRNDFKTKTLEKIDPNTLREKLWTVKKLALQETAAVVIPEKVHVRPAKSWMTDKTLNLMDERRRAEGINEVQYNTIGRAIRTKCKEAKGIWLDSECKEIEEQILYKFQCDLRQDKEAYSTNKSGVIRFEDGIMLTESEEICDR